MPAAQNTMESTDTTRMAIWRCREDPGDSVTTRIMRTTRKMRNTRSVRATIHASALNADSAMAMPTRPGTMVM
jgi:hypothetical protein